MAECGAAFRRGGVRCGSAAKGTSSCSPPFLDIQQMHGHDADKAFTKALPNLKPHMTDEQHDAYTMAADAIHYGGKIDRMMGFEAQLLLFGGALNHPLSGLPTVPDPSLPYGFIHEDNSGKLRELTKNMLEAQDAIMYQLLACSVEGRPNWVLNCPVTPSAHNQGHLNDLTLESPHTNVVTEEIGEGRNQPARACSIQFAVGDQAGTHRRILICMDRADRRAWKRDGGERMRHESAARLLVQHHRGKPLSGKELGKYLVCQFVQRWPTCHDKLPYTFEWVEALPGASSGGSCVRREHACSIASVLASEYLESGGLTVKLRAFVESNAGKEAARRTRKEADQEARRKQKAAEGPSGDDDDAGATNEDSEEQLEGGEDDDDDQEFHGEDGELFDDEDARDDNEEDIEEDGDDDDDDEYTDGDDVDDDDRDDDAEA